MVIFGEVYQDGSGFSRGIFLIVFGLVEFEDDDEGIVLGVVIVGHGYLVVFLVGSPAEHAVSTSQTCFCAPVYALMESRGHLWSLGCC